MVWDYTHVPPIRFSCLSQYETCGDAATQPRFQSPGLSLSSFRAFPKNDNIIRPILSIFLHWELPHPLVRYLKQAGWYGSAQTTYTSLDHRHPLYFVAIQPFVQPYKNSQMFFAKEIIRVVEPKSQIYCLSSEEVLAWVGQRYEGIQKLSLDDPSLVSQTLFNARAGSYLVIGEKDYTSLLKYTEAIPGELVISHKVSHHEKMMLFRLGKRTSETP